MGGRRRVSKPDTKRNTTLKDSLEESSPSKRKKSSSTKRITKKTTRKSAKGITKKTKKKDDKESKKTYRKKRTIQKSTKIKKTEKKELEKKGVEETKYYPPQLTDKNGEKAVSSTPDIETNIVERYYDNKIVLLARDPYWCYSYWDLSPGLIEEKRKLLKTDWGSYSFALRVYDVTDIIFNGENAHKFQDILITNDADNWYINVSESGRTYIVDIGFKTEDGHFITIARSNSVTTPEDKISDIEDEEWIEVDENYNAILKASKGEGVSSGSENVSSFSIFSQLSEQEKKFDIDINSFKTDIVITGKSLEGDLFINDKIININQDGSFAEKVSIDEGENDIKVVIKKGKNIKNFIIKINKQTILINE